MRAKVPLSSSPAPAVSIVRKCVYAMILIISYYRYWGFVRASKRIIKSLIFPAAENLISEFSIFARLKSLPRQLKRTPDYVIMSPDYASSSAGISCLHKLAHDLMTMGFETAVTGAQVGNPNFPVPLMSIPDARRAANGGAWVVYPETVFGNPLNARNIVRWALNRPGLLGGEEVYDSREHVFVYSDAFAPYVKNRIAGKLYMPTLDTKLFYPPEQAKADRTLEIFYVGKSTYKPGLFSQANTFEITRKSPARSELGKLFRSARILYSFDNSTALIYEALLCGCPVVVIPDGTQTWADYESLELGTTGLHWGPPTTLPTPFDPSELRARLENTHRQFAIQLRYLVTYTQTISPSRLSDYQQNLSKRSQNIDYAPQIGLSALSD